MTDAVTVSDEKLAEAVDVIHRAQVFPLRLNRAQAHYMANAAGAARFAYNWALEQWKKQAKEWWDSGKVSPYPTGFALQRQFTEAKATQFPWLSEVSSHVYQPAILQVADAVTKFRNGNARYPRFKRRGRRRSFVACKSRQELRIEGQHVVLPRLGRIRLRSAIRWPDATPIRAVVSERGGRWYIAVNFEIERQEAEPRPAIAAGVDLGIKTPLVVASGDLTLHLGSGLSERLNVERRKLRRANKTLHRRVKGSGRRRRAQQRIARIHLRMTNIRSDVQHKATCTASRLASRIGVETLSVRGMLSNGRLARSISDVGFFEIKRQLKYKANEVVEADMFYPSSKTCSACGCIKQSLKLSDRTFRCEECGFECDRDENAARNLEKMAANWVVSARGDGSSARRRKSPLRSLSMKREAAKAVQLELQQRSPDGPADLAQLQPSRAALKYPADQEKSDGVGNDNDGREDSQP